MFKKILGFFDVTLIVLAFVAIVTICSTITISALYENHHEDLINCKVDNPRAIISIEGKTIDVYVTKLYETKNSWKIYTVDGRWYKADKQNVVFYGKD